VNRPCPSCCHQYRRFYCDPVKPDTLTTLPGPPGVSRYNPSTARFLSRDPVDGRNDFEYCGGDPLACSDVAGFLVGQSLPTEYETRCPQENGLTIRQTVKVRLGIKTIYGAGRPAAARRDIVMSTRTAGASAPL
jgi:hypothetical protein